MTENLRIAEYSLTLLDDLAGADVQSGLARFAALEEWIDSSMARLSTTREKTGVEINIALDVTPPGGLTAQANGDHIVFSNSLSQRSSRQKLQNESLIKSLQELRARWAASRPAAASLRESILPSAGMSAPSPVINVPSALSSILRGTIRSQGINQLQQRNLHQAVLESAALAKIVDAPQRLSRNFRLVGKSGVNLAQLAHELDQGTRKFARDLAWFLLRSCLGRPGAEKLQGILRIVLEESCFPYTNGEYLKNPTIHLLCRDNALQ